MDTVALLLSRLAFTILIHIIFSGLHTDFLSFGTLPSGSWPYIIPFLPSRKLQRCNPVLHACFGERVSFCLSADAVLHSNQLRHL
jgi:hypothetical protein